MRVRHLRSLWALLVALVFMTCCLAPSPAHAASCNLATSQGSTGPANWQTYCWLDFAGYNDTTARSGSGQSFSYTLTDGTVLSFNLKVSGAALLGKASPSWSGAAVGNTAFLGIAGKPILYQGAAGTTTITISSIMLTPPSTGTITNYMLVAADGESSNQGESLSYQTNGGNWQMLDASGPISGSTYPYYSGVGTSTFTETGVAGTVGAYVAGSSNPTQVTATLVGGGLQGVMFAVRFASIRLSTQITGARVDPSDQFAFSINATGTGSTLAAGSSSGTGLGPFAAASLSSSAAIPLTLQQSMASGSANALTHYRSSLSCTNATSGSSTPLPGGVITSTYNFGSLQFGDNVLCIFTETPYPHLQLSKVLAGSGRQFSSDQFVLNISQGTTVVATTTTTGTGSTILTGTTPQYQGNIGITYTFDEQGAGATALSQYTATMTCSNAAGSSTTVLPVNPGDSVTPQMGDVITCTITNSKRTSNATLVVTKSSVAASDPINGSINAKAIPGAIISYTITVQNTGTTRVDRDSLFILDALPSQIAVGSAASPNFTQGSPSSGLTLTPSSDVRYSNSNTAPASFSDCTYTPTSPYDPAVTYLCINPKGRMAASTGTPPSFSISFQSQIK